jgi:phospholipid/cholesterol/gamma-HCH transport system substrate-binding protein
MPNSEQSSTDFRVGLMTFTALCFLILGITFAGGDKGLLFRKTSTVKAWVEDVGGLKSGSPVTMGGMIIGKVTSLHFVEHEGKPGIGIVMAIREDMRANMKVDSKPYVRTQGMLGDRYVEISPGAPASPALPEGSILTGPAPADFDSTLREANAAFAETTKILEAINTQRGNAGQFIYDQKFYEQLTGISEEVHGLVQDFKKNPRRYVKLSIF